MKFTVDTRRTFAVAVGFSVVVALSLLAAYVSGFIPSLEEKCLKQCRQEGMEGHLQHIYSAEQTAGMRSRGPQECKCSRPGTYDPLQR